MPTRPYKYMYVHEEDFFAFRQLVFVCMMKTTIIIISRYVCMVCMYMYTFEVYQIYELGSYKTSITVGGMKKIVESSRT